MSIKLTSTRERKVHVNFLIYGEAGVGKTTLSQTAEEPLIISAEGGLLALSDVDIPVFEIKNREGVNEVYDWLTMGEHKYRTICIDSLSEIAEVLLSDEKAKTKDARQAYGVMNTEMEIMIRAFRDLPFDVYFSAKMKRMVDEGSGKVSFIPSVPGNSLLQALPYFFDEVFVMKNGKLDDGSNYRYIQTQGDTQYTAKDRSGCLDPIVKPDLGEITAAIKSGVRKDKPKKEKK